MTSAFCRERTLSELRNKNDRRDIFGRSWLDDTLRIDIALYCRPELCLEFVVVVLTLRQDAGVAEGSFEERALAIVRLIDKRVDAVEAYR